MRALIAVAVMAVSVGAFARGHRGYSHSHYSYHAPAHHSAPTYHPPVHHKIAHHVARTAATTATRNVVNKAMKLSRNTPAPMYNNYSRSVPMSQPFPPVPATLVQCKAFAKGSRDQFQRCETANGRGLAQ